MSSVPRSGLQPIEHKFPFTVGSNQAENKLSEEQGPNHRMKLLPLLPGFPSSVCAVCSVCPRLLPQMAFEPAGLFQPSWAGDGGSKTSIPYQVAKMQSCEHWCGRGMQGSAAGRHPDPSEGCAWAWPAPPAHPRLAEIHAEKAKLLQKWLQGPYLLSMKFSGKQPVLDVAH